MASSTHDTDLGAVVAELGSGVRVLSGRDEFTGRKISGAALWTPGDEPPDDASLVMVIGPQSTGGLEIVPLLAALDSRIVFLCGDSGGQLDPVLEALGDNVVVEVSPSLNVGTVITAIARLTQPVDEAVSRRLGSLQRSLTLALADATPVPALLSRLKRTCNATAVLMDRAGKIVYSTGPIPRSLVFKEVSSTKADTQVLSVDGWRGLAARVSDSSATDDHIGWLVLASRRADFPDTYATSAVHVAASLVEASHRMAAVVGQQERAVRAAVLEQALALRPERSDAELAARVAGLGITFETEVRVAVATILRTPRIEHRQEAIDSVSEVLGRALTVAGHPFLMTPRGNGVTILVSCSVVDFQRLLASHEEKLPELQVGVGRPISEVGQVVDSYNDAQLAVRTLRRVARDQQLMVYEDFDFAIRLFADVGLETMVAWARDFLRPLDDRENLLSGLRAYFEHDQNINEAADVLNLHHNSLRYRLAKVEELLTINLKQPASVSSVFLALTAIDLSRQPTASKPHRSGARQAGAVADTDAPSTATEFTGPMRSSAGIVFGPEN